jgi:hypothetical protein
MVLPTLLIASVIIAGLVVETWLTLCLVGLVYVGSIPFSVWSARKLRKAEARVTTPEPAAPAGEAAAAERIVALGPRQQRP